MGNDNSYQSSSNTLVKDYIYSTGFHELDSNVKGRYIVVRRTGWPTYKADAPFSLGKLNVFQCQNLLQVDGVTASITSDTSPAPPSSEFVATNLIENLSIRASSTTYCPPINENQDQVPCYKSCFKSDQDDWLDDKTFILGIDLGDSYFAHSVMLTADLGY